MTNIIIIKEFLVFLLQQITGLTETNFQITTRAERDQIIFEITVPEKIRRHVIGPQGRTISGINALLNARKRHYRKHCQVLVMK